MSQRDGSKQSVDQDWRTDRTVLAVVMENGKATVAGVAREHVLGRYDFEIRRARETDWRYQLVELDQLTGPQDELARQVAERAVAFRATTGKTASVVVDVTKAGTAALDLFRKHRCGVRGVTILHEVPGAEHVIWSEVVGVLRTRGEQGKFGPAPGLRGTLAFGSAAARELKLPVAPAVGTDSRLTAGALALYWLDRHPPLMIGWI